MDDGRTKILRNVDNYQSRRRNVSENLSLNFYLLILPSRNLFEICQFFLKGLLYCFCVILCRILVTTPERATFIRCSAFAGRPVSLTAVNTVLVFLSVGFLFLQRKLTKVGQIKS